MSDSRKITVEIRVEDAYAITMGALNYVMDSNAGKVPKDGSPYRARVAIAESLKEYEQTVRSHT